MVKVLMWLAVAALGMVGAPAFLQAQTVAHFLEIEAAPFHACGRVADGSVLCWGANDQGQLGSGKVRDRRFARRVHGIWSPVTAIGTGESHSCAIAALGRLRCWGRNAEGQLGNDTQTGQLVAGPVAGPRRRFTAVAGGIDHSCALTASTRVFCWGANPTGAVGDGTTQNRLVPTLVGGLPRGQVEIGTGYRFSCARNTVGAVACWGSNVAGRLGNGRAGDSVTPVRVTGLNADAQALSVGVNHACALAAAGLAVCWGATTLARSVTAPQRNRAWPRRCRLQDCRSQSA
ncbi:RCC1 domain-containing protein [Pararhodobacter zhoushanensis]|uniref:Regulator of chromosome condensation (RCC1) repeat-containing protein n=1 Tax=Pararhodobacter zhoushanensis TaxID=2479545 RepID=A0ABT3H084_9RHOB|nr:hypothetical protein [Pararhodobacter zhoushanensis]MCW1933120.1 hypothetical protein [Pararhodobacter zhoushanensis]